MQALRIALCEDERQEVQNLLERVSACGIAAETSVFGSAEAFLEGYAPGSFDLVLMDIYLEGLSGLEAVRRIRERGEKLPVAFITTSQDHALDAYRLNVEKYLEKPVSQDALLEVLRLALERRESRPGVTVFSGGKPLRLPAGEIIYIEQKAHYLVFNLPGKKTVQVKGKLDALQPQLSGLPFFRCHKSFIANLAYVTGIDRELMLFQMREGAQVYIRREDLKAARLAWEGWLFSAARGEGMQG